MSLSVHQKDGDCSVFDQGLTHAAENRLAQRSVLVASDHDHFGSDRRPKVRELGGCVSFGVAQQSALHFDSMPGELGCQVIEGVRSQFRSDRR